MLKALLAAALLPFLPAHGQFVPPPTDLISTTGYLDTPVRYKQVPSGICELTPGVKSYTGYVDVSENEHIFFWFFERRHDPDHAPLTVWLTGGPGSSSMIGLFEELGPCRIDEAGEPYPNKYAWNNVSNMLFIDQPAQSGFSYSTPIPGYVGNGGGKLVTLPSNDCPSYGNQCGTYSYPSVVDTANSTITAAPTFWRTLQGFFGAAPFTKYVQHGFNFATESYGGHWGPVYSEYIAAQNAAISAGQLPGAHTIDVQTLLIINGWIDPLLHYASYYNFTVGNTYDVRLNSTSQEEELFNAVYGPGNCVDRIKNCYAMKRNDVCIDADNFCLAELEPFVLFKTLLRDQYDIRELSPDAFPPRYWVEYLNTPEVQRAIGAYTNISRGSGFVYSVFATTADDVRTEGSVEDCRALADQGVYLALFNGDADFNVNWLGSEAVVDLIDAPGMSTAGYANISSSDGVVHGVVKQAANFAFARIYNSGHEVPFYQPLTALEIFDRVINGYDIATGELHIKKGDAYKTGGPAKSTYHEGNATVQFQVLPPNSTYNTMTNKPNPPDQGLEGQSYVGRRNIKSLREPFSRMGTMPWPRL